MINNRDRSIGLLLVVVACLVAILSAWTPCCRWIAVQDWAEVPAVVRSVKLKERQASDTQKVLRVVASYVYRYAGEEYRGELVLLRGGSALDSRDARKYTELQALIAAGGETVCYVNPVTPSEAVLDRSLRYEDLLLLLAGSSVFLGAGVALFARNGRSVLGAGRRGSLGERFGLTLVMVGFNATVWLLIAYSAKSSAWLYDSAAGVGLITLLMVRSGRQSSKRAESS